MDNDPSLLLSGRKRSRGTSSGRTTPTRGVVSGATTPLMQLQQQLLQQTQQQTLPSQQTESSDDRVRAAQLRDPKQRVKALNSLLKLSSSHDVNYALSGDSILTSLWHVTLECLDWNDDNHSNQEDPARSPCHVDMDEEEPVFSVSTAWTKPPTRQLQEWASHWKAVLRESPHGRPSPTEHDPLQLLEVIVAIWRNLSFVGANLRLLAYTPPLLAVLMGCLYEAHNGGDEGLYGGAANGASTYEYRGYIPRAEQAAHMAGAATEDARRQAQRRSSLVTNALQTLVHLSPLLDVSGHKLLADTLFYAFTANKDAGPLVPNAALFGQVANGRWGFGGLLLAKRIDTKEDIMTLSPQAAKELLLSSSSLPSSLSSSASSSSLGTADYLVAIWSLFPALTHVFTNPCCPRAVMIGALDVLMEFINQARSVGIAGSVDWEEERDDDALPSLRALLVSIPDAVLERLLDLLYIPRQGPDSMDYLDPAHHLVSRTDKLKYMIHYNTVIDAELRDRALEALVPLLELDSPRMALRVGLYPPKKTGDNNTDKGLVRTRLWDALVPILTTTVGRNDATLLGAQMFRELAKGVPDNRMGLQYVQGRLVELASQDHRVAHLLWNDLVPALSSSKGDDASDNDDNGSKGDPDDTDEQK